MPLGKFPREAGELPVTSTTPDLAGALEAPAASTPDLPRALEVPEAPTPDLPGALEAPEAPTPDLPGALELLEEPQPRTARNHTGIRGRDPRRRYSINWA